MYTAILVLVTYQNHLPQSWRSVHGVCWARPAGRWSGSAPSPRASWAPPFFCPHGGSWAQMSSCGAPGEAWAATRVSEDDCHSWKQNREWSDLLRSNLYYIKPNRDESSFWSMLHAIWCLSFHLPTPQKTPWCYSTSLEQFITGTGQSNSNKPIFVKFIMFSFQLYLQPTAAKISIVLNQHLSDRASTKTGHYNLALHFFRLHMCT